MPQTIVEKIAQAHLADGPNRPLRAGDFVSIRPFHVMTHDNTSAVMSKFKAIGAKKIFDPRQLVFALDHDIQNRDEANLKKYRSIETFANDHRVDFYPAGSGIGHQIMIERGYVLPGSFVVASDSHSNMYGALGAVGTPIVRTDAAAAWATGEFWWQIPRTIQVVLEGKLPEGISGKDVIITLCGLYNHDEALNAAVILRPRRRKPADGRALLHLQHEHGVGAARRLVPGRRGHNSILTWHAPALKGARCRALHRTRH
jgi:homoaconitate hydratase